MTKYGKPNGGIAKKLGYGLLLGAMIVNLTGCKVDDMTPATEGENENASDSTNEIPDETHDSKKSNEAIGYYNKVALEVPDELNPVHISKADKGGLYVVTQKDGSADCVWHVDNDDNWQKELDIRGVLSLDENAYCMAYVSPQGELFAQYNKDIYGSDEFQIDTGKMEYCFVSSSGELTNIDIKLPALSDSNKEFLEEKYGEKADYVNSIFRLKFIDDAIYMEDLNCDVYQIDKSGNNLKCVFDNEENEHVPSFFVYDGTFVTWNSCKSSANFIGIDNRDNEQNLAERFSDFIKNSQGKYSEVNMDVDDNLLWTLSGDRISYLNLENNESNNLKALGNEIFESIFYFTVSDDIPYILSSIPGKDKNDIFKFILNDSEGETDISSNKLKIWALEPMSAPYSAASLFTEKYPNIDIEIEIGMANAESGITESDAIKNLNTEILAGNGPDIIYMDGLTYGKYVESGMLEDITSLVNSISNGGEYFDNILNCYSKDGSVFTVPLAFSVVEKVGTKEDIKASENLKDFVEYVLQNRDRTILYEGAVSNYVVQEYYKEIQPSIMSGNVDKEKLGEYFEAAKKLVTLYEYEYINISTEVMFFISNLAGNYDGTFSFVTGNVCSIFNFEEVEKEMADGINGVAELPARDFSNRFMPLNCMSINAKSNNKDLAEEYIRYMLSEEFQSQPMNMNGFAINIDALKSYTINMHTMYRNPEGNPDIIVNTDAVEANLEMLINSVDAMNEPIYVDTILDQIVFEGLNQYIQGVLDKDSAINSIVQKVNLYISE